jgi:hypothetical protein
MSVLLLSEMRLGKEKKRKVDAFGIQQRNNFTRVLILIDSNETIS